MTEDFDVFFEDFAKPVTGPNSSSGKGILDEPDRIFNDPVGVISTEYSLLVKTSDFAQLNNGDSMTVDSVGYTVREALKIEDGQFTKVLLTKNA